MTRYLEENGAPVTFYLPSKFVHSLITVGTPNTGTAMATTLWKYKDAVLALSNPIYLKLCGLSLPCTLSEVLSEQGKVVDTAVEDMRTALSTPTVETYKSLAGDAPPASGLAAEFNALLASFVPGVNKSFHNPRHN